MPFEFTFEHPPLGHALASAKRDDHVLVERVGLYSASDGDVLMQRLEGFPSEVLQRSACGITPPEVNHMLCIIRADGSAIAYINELQISTTTQINRACLAGEAIMVDDIVDIRELRMGEVEVPDTTGIIVVLSHGWRKAYLYDFTPLPPEPSPRSYSLPVALAQLYCMIAFNDLMGMTETELDQMLAQQWFPFRGIPHQLLKQMLSHVREGWQLDDLLKEISGATRQKIGALRAAVSAHVLLKGHEPIILQALDRYEAADFISATSILYTRLEGIMRSILAAQGTVRKPSAVALSDAVGAAGAMKRHALSLIMPDRFRTYLRNVYFADFNPADPQIKVSRHSVAHGTAAAEAFSEKAATIGVLVLQQILYCSSEVGRSS